MSGDAEWAYVDQARELALQREREAEAISQGYRTLSERVVFVDATYADRPYDRTHLLLLGQERAPISIMRVKDSITFAAAFDSGVNFVQLFNLNGGMPRVIQPIVSHNLILSPREMQAWRC